MTQVGLAELKSSLPTECKVLAVSKLQSKENINYLLKQGQMDFAENYVQEALEKQDWARSKGLQIRWHFIGHLQTNKVKSIAEKFEYIHSVDSLRLLKAISVHTSSSHKQKIFLQVNIAQEASKGGFSIEEMPQIFAQAAQLQNLEVVGLMTMPPLCENPEDSRPHFQRLKELLIAWQKICPTLTELSMGTSGDFRVAAEEGATWVRLGTVLFGERSKH
jgi:pyridoxal phosphate enzyme (YggS family)